MGRTMSAHARLGVLGAIGVLAVAATAVAQRQAGPPRHALSYDQVFGTSAYGGGDQPAVLAEVPQVTEWVDATHYLETRRETDGRRRVYVTSAADGTSRLVGPADPTAETAPGAAFRVVLRDHDLMRVDADGSERRLTATPAADEDHTRLSPTGTHLAYVRGNNLFAYDLATGLERQLTADGSETILNGTPSWIYMEEILGRGSNAFWWSPDGTRLAFMRFDDAPVPTFPIYHADGQHGTLEITRYPKAGDPNPYVRIGVVSIVDGKTAWMDFEEKADHYLAFPKWATDNRTLFVQWMNRAQDTLKVFACDASTGKTSAIHEETQRSWVDWYDDLTPLADGSLLFVSDVDGWRHLYRYAKGEPARQLTKGAWRVHQILEVTEASGTVYFLGRPGKSWDTQVMRLRLAGGEPEIVSKDLGAHKAAVSPDGAFVVDTWTTLTAPARVTLRRGDGSVVREIASAASAPGYAGIAWGRAELFTIPSGDGKYQLPAYWILPADFSPGRRYPVIMTVYGGPDAGSVQNGWPGLSAHYWAQRGVITISVDHRGSGHFGKAGSALMHRQLGTWEMTDLSAAAAWLRSRPFVRGDRIGITGASYGGYTTAMAMTFAAGQFNFGIAGSSGTDWQLYDSVYTERYMDLPSENPEGYRASAVMTWLDRYKGGLRLTHGTIDDNVHLQQTMQLVDALTVRNQRFELMVYPDSRHGIQPLQRPHQARESHDFWVRNLLGGRLPDVVVGTDTGRRDTGKRERGDKTKDKEKERTP